jgi:hypothetical protein
MTDQINDAAVDALLAHPPDGDVWVLEFKSLPGPRVPTHLRVRSLLKAMLRQWHLRCTRVSGVVVCDQCKKSSATPVTPQ